MPSSAEKYQIMCGVFCAYIAKPSKRNPRRMLDDRRKITEEEILDLIDWYLNKQHDKGLDCVRFDSIFAEDKTIELRYAPQETS